MDHEKKKNTSFQQKRYVSIYPRMHTRRRTQKSVNHQKRKRKTREKKLKKAIYEIYGVTMHIFIYITATFA